MDHEARRASPAGAHARETLAGELVAARALPGLGIGREIIGDVSREPVIHELAHERALARA
jgi:hypothetical protein